MRASGEYEERLARRSRPGLRHRCRRACRSGYICGLAHHSDDVGDARGRLAGSCGLEKKEQRVDASTVVVYQRPVHGSAWDASAVATAAPSFRRSSARLPCQAVAGTVPQNVRLDSRPRCAGVCRRVGAARAGEARCSAGVLPHLPADGAMRLGGGAVYDVSHDSPGSERLRTPGSECAIAGHAPPAE